MAAMTEVENKRYEEQHRRWYAEWIRKQYDGPGCRAKIVGRAKYERIVRAVRGELRRAADNSKFRFWVRAKGFRMGRPASGAGQVDDGNSLYVVDTKNGGSAAFGGSQHCYKKVAVVDEFFDIIYRVHCSGGGVSARHSGQKRTHRMIMETYVFLPREAVTAFLMGCPQCSTNSAASTAVCASVDGQQRLPQPPAPITAGGFGRDEHDERWSSSSSFACSTPVKCGTENRCAGETITADGFGTGAAGADKENITDNDGQTGATALVSVPANAGRNRRKRAVPLKRDVREPYQVLAVAAASPASTTALSGDTSTGSSTLKNSTNSSCTLIMSSSSSRSDRSGVSRSSGGWWSKEEMCSNRIRLSASCSSRNSSGSSAGASNMQPLDLSSSPLMVISPAPNTTVRSSSSPLLEREDFFYKRRRVCRRRVKPKRLNRPSFNRCGGRQEDDNTSTSDRDDNDDEVARDSHRRNDIDKEIVVDNRHAREMFLGKRVGDLETNKGNDGPKPAKLKRKLEDRTVDRRNNNNDDNCYDKVAAMATTSTVATVSCCTGAGGRTIKAEVVVVDVVTEQASTTLLETQEEITENKGSEANELDENQEKSAAMHSPMNKRINGSGHHPYHMHHNSRSIMNGLATSSSSSLSKSLDTITTSNTTHHNFHRHWLDMANDSVNNTNMMDVDGSADDNSMAAAAAAAAAALLFSPPSSVGSGISPSGLSSLHPNSHLAHHHALSPLAPLALPPHSASGVGLSSAHHHHHQHIQQQLQQYAAAAVAAATAAAAAAAAASSAGDSTSPPPNLPLSLPPMAHHFNPNNNISGSNKRRSGGTGLTVQQQLYRRSGTPTSSTTSSPSPRPLNSKSDADTTTSGTSLHENGSFSVTGPPTTTTTVLWPPLGLLTAAHQQHHHSLSSPPKFQQLFGSSVNSLATATVGSQVLPSLPPPPISSPSTSYRLASKETNGMVVTTTNGNVTGNDIGIGTGTENAIHADEEDPAIDDDEDEEDEEDEEEEEEDLDDDEIEEGEDDADEEEENDRAVDGGDGNSTHTRRLRRQQVRRLRQLQRTGRGNNTQMNDNTDSGITTNYHQQWQQPSTTSTTANSSSQQQHRQSIGSSSQQHIDPERLKAFNMFVRLFVDENLDRQVPISRQPKDKVQAIIDSCGRQFPELSDRSRKRIRTYLKSCRRNKRNTPQSGGVVSSSPPPPTNPWPANGSSTDPSVQPQRPTPAHLTSAQAETILAVACQRESDNARRMRLGLEPVAQPYPYSVTPTSVSNVFQQPAGTLLLNQNGNGGTKLQMSSTSSDEDAAVGDSSFDKSSSNANEADTDHHNGNDETENQDVHGGREGNVSTGSVTASDLTSINNTTTEDLNTITVTCGANVTSSSPNNNEATGPTDLSLNKTSSATTTTIDTNIVASTPPVPIGSGYTSNSGFRGLSSSTSTTTVNHRRVSSNNSSSTTGMLQLFPTMSTPSSISGGASSLPLQPSMLNQTTPPTQPSSKLLNKADVVTVRQLIAGYRESAAFLLRSADELEHLLLLRG